MDNRELNLNMAVMCRIVVVAGGRCGEGYPYIGDYTTGNEGSMWLYVSGKVDSVVWNPVANWQQVFDYVLPALERAGCDWVIRSGIDKDTRIAIWYDQRRNPTERFASKERSASRTLCEAAWEAWQQLEKS